MTNVMQRPPSGPPQPGPVSVAARSPRRTPRGVRALWKVFAAVLVVAGIVWGAYNVAVLLAHETREENESFPAAGLSAIVVDNSAGSVRVVATDGDTVEVRAEISEGLRATGESREVVGDVLELRGTCPNYGSDWCRVRYEIQAPRSLALTIDADNGSVDLSGFTGTVDVDSDNGSIEVRGLSGSLDLSTDNGRIEGTALRSPTVIADSDNGRVTLEFAAPPTMVEATSDNGSVEVVVPNDGEAYAVDLSTDNGTPTVAIPTNPASPRSLRLATNNGDVTARTAP